MSARRRSTAILVLFLLGFGMIALADALDAYWPLFLTPLPYAAIPYLIVHEDDPGSAEPDAT